MADNPKSLSAHSSASENWTELAPRIIVFGVGGAGGNAVDNMIGSELTGVDFVAANTDAQALARSKATHRIQLGANITQGLGAGARPDVGRQAAEDSIEEIRAILKGAHMAFITAGMGGGTGTGAAPVIAKLAREAGLLVVAVVTRPFDFEGAKRMRVASEGIEALTAEVDTLIVIPNQNLFRIANDKTTVMEAFKLADEVLHSGVRGVTDLMTRPGLINLDFADVRTVMNEMGKAMMGTGEATGEGRALAAAEAAISNPLLDDVTLRGAKAVLINITGGHDMTLFEVNQATNAIRDEVDPEANIIVGSAFDEALDGILRVSVVATGITDENETSSPYTPRQSFFDRHRESSKDIGQSAAVAATTVADAEASISRMPVHDAPDGREEEPLDVGLDSAAPEEAEERLVEAYTPDDAENEDDFLPEHDAGMSSGSTAPLHQDRDPEPDDASDRYADAPVADDTGYRYEPREQEPPVVPSRVEDRASYEEPRLSGSEDDSPARDRGRRFHPPADEDEGEPRMSGYRERRDQEPKQEERGFMPFSLFGGRRRRKPAEDARENERTRNEARPRPGDEPRRYEPDPVEEASEQDDLEIPAFLRRQNIRER